ncbi:MAG: magnesium transporter CorA family protein [Clostridiales bacterium]|nr:magnesium transporter CorA family protein [Clostridiales bacterium]
MLEIYSSVETKQKANRSIYRTEKIDRIGDDCWINLYSPTEPEISRIENELNIPQEFLRYPLDEEERPRIDFDDDTGDVLVIIDVPYSKRDNNMIRYETAPLGIIITDKQIVTVSLRQTPILDQFIDNRVKDLFILFRTRFTIQILYAVAKEYLRLLRFIDKTIDINEVSISETISNKDLYNLLELSKSLVYFSSSLKSDEAVLEKLMRGRTVKLYDDDEDLLEDVVIEFKQAHEMAEIYSNIVSTTSDAYASIINNNMNVVMKVLAAATICLTLPDLIGSFFGQNCPMPWDENFAENPVPFLFLLGFALFSLIVSFIVMRKKKII